jgi:hypothetical protein
MPTPDDPLVTLQLHVTLNDIEPPIWRRFWVEDTITLPRLHEVLQIVMGWQDVHLHQFITGSTHEDQLFYGVPDDDDFGDPEFMARQRDEARVRARKLLPLEGDSITYEYDFGDGWEHQLLLEKVVSVDRDGPGLPWCLEGRRACPPEDVGGTGGYGDFLEAFSNPHHEEHGPMRKWGGDFDPERFDRNAVNIALWWWAEARGRHRRARR